MGLNFSSPFDVDAVEFLEQIGVSRYKVASMEITDIPLIRHIASKNKPIIISTGLADILDIERAVEACKSVGNADITLLKCTSDYPAQFSNANIATMIDMTSRFGVGVGVSDHTPGFIVPVSAAVCGAQLIEKHIIFDKTIKSPDSHFSLDVGEFGQMVQHVREATECIGKVVYDVSPTDRLRRRSLFYTVNLEKGSVLEKTHVRSVRPGHGLAPEMAEQLIGRVMRQSIQAGDPVKTDHFI